jgi:hypothetical protein
VLTKVLTAVMAEAAKQEFLALLSENGVDDRLQKVVITDGYVSLKLFTKCFSTEDKLDRYLSIKLVNQKVLGDSATQEDFDFHPQVGMLRTALEAAQEKVALQKKEAEEPEQRAPEGSQQLQLATLASSMGVHKTVGCEERERLEKAFLAKYGGVALCDTTRPGCVMLWAFKRMKDKDVGLVWLSWSYFKSLDQENFNPQMAAKIIKSLATMGFGSAAIASVGKEPDPGAVQELADFEGGAYRVRAVLELRAVAMAMLDLVDLGAANYYVTSFMNLFTRKYTGISMRAPDLKEAIEADRLAMTAAFQIVNSKTATLTEALKAVASPMGELAVYMGPKPGLLSGGAGKGAVGKDVGRKRKREDTPAAATCWNWRRGKCWYGEKCKFSHR